MLKIAIIDDNFEFVENLFNLITTNIKNIKIVKIFTDGNSAIKYILNEKVDVILLDLNLPNINGIEIIEEINNKNIDTKIIAMSGDNSFIIDLLKKNLNIERLFTKPFEIKSLIDTFKKLESNSMKIERRDIVNLLNPLSFNKNNIGYFYIIEIIEYCLENKYKNIPSNNELYKYIAKKNNCDNYLRVGWNIDKAIKTMYKLTDSKTINEFFTYNISPSTKNFLNSLVDKFYTININKELDI